MRHCAFPPDSGHHPALHPAALIEWVNDSLPHLVLTLKREEKFDAISLFHQSWDTTVTYVWEHNASEA